VTPGEKKKPREMKLRRRKSLYQGERGGRRSLFCGKKGPNHQRGRVAWKIKGAPDNPKEEEILKAWILGEKGTLPDHTEKKGTL